MPDQQQQQQVAMEDVTSIYGEDCMGLKLSIRHLQREIIRLQKELEAEKAKKEVKEVA